MSSLVSMTVVNVCMYTVLLCNQPLRSANYLLKFNESLSVHGQRLNCKIWAMATNHSTLWSTEMWLNMCTALYHWAVHTASPPSDTTEQILGGILALHSQ